MIRSQQLKLALSNLSQLNVLNHNLFGRVSSNNNVTSSAGISNTSQTKINEGKTQNVNKKLQLELVSKKEMVRLLTRLRLSHLDGHTCLTTSCLKNSRSKLKLDLLSKVHINSTTGHFVCENCMMSGSWQTWVESCQHFEDLLEHKKRLPSSCFTEEANAENITENPSSLHAQHTYLHHTLSIADCDEAKLSSLLNNLNLQHLHPSTLEAYLVRVSTQYNALLLPLFSFKKILTAVKILSIEEEEEEEGENGVEGGASNDVRASSGGSSFIGGNENSGGNSNSPSDGDANRGDGGKMSVRTCKAEGVDSGGVDGGNEKECILKNNSNNNNDDDTNQDDGNSEDCTSNDDGKDGNDTGKDGAGNDGSSNDFLESVHDVAKRFSIKSTIIPSPDVCGLFGYHLLLPSKSNNKRLSNNNNNNSNNNKLNNNYNKRSGKDGVVVTCSEVDAMCVYQGTSRVAVALSQGGSVLSQKVLPLLEGQDKLVLWFGGDQNTWQNMRMCARKLNIKRCHLVRPDKGTPTEAVLRRDDLEKVLKSSRSITHQSIVTFQHLREDLLAQLSDGEAMAGIQWTRYPHLNRLLKGHRRGELTVMTGPTGSGKTTLMSDYSLDLSMQGVNTLWGSFEINNIKLLKTMLSQFSKMDLSKHLEHFNHHADLFEKLPIFFMTFHGQENIQKVIETMSHAAYVHDIAHVIVDNLQFMIGLEDGHDRFLKQDLVISAFRKFATHTNCHVTLVIHPRKEKETENLSISSIFGSAKATQEADNVLILQDNRLLMSHNRKFLQVAKNRYDGELGVMRLKFNRESLTFSCPDDPPPFPSDHSPTPPSSSSLSSSSSSPSLPKLIKPPQIPPQSRLPSLIPLVRKPS